MCDCDRPAASSEVWPTARVPHVCCECGGTIEPGQKYQRYSGVWDHRGQTFKTCEVCAHARAEHVSHLTSHYDCWPAFGDLWGDISDSYGMTREEWLAMEKSP